MRLAPRKGQTDPCHRLNTIEIIVFPIVGIILALVFLTREDTNIWSISGCLTCIFGLWVCILMAYVFHKEKNPTDTDKWFILHIAFLTALFTIKFLRRFDFTG